MADLRHLGKTDGRRRVAELLEQFDLVDAATKPVGVYSGGMRRRLDLAMTLVGDPRIIFLDEPTAGLDPRSRRVMWDIIHDLVGRGVTIFLTTQYLEEADRLAHRIAVLDHGKLVAQGTPNELKRLVSGGHIQLSFGDATELARAARIFTDGAADEEALTLNIPSDGGTRSLRELLDRLDAGSIDVGGLVVQTPDLDDVFLSLTGDHQTSKRRSFDEHLSARRDRHGDDAPPQPPPGAPLPVADVLHRRHPGRVPAAVRLRPRRNARRRPGRRGRWPRRIHGLRPARDPAGHGRRRGPGDGDLGRHGHVRRASSPGSAPWPSPARRSSPATSSAA